MASAVADQCECSFEVGDNPMCPTHGTCPKGLHEYRGQSHPFKLSRYQRAVVDWFLDGSGNAVVNAVAGSGKTATLVCLAKYITQPAVFCAFNKHISVELGNQLSWHETIQVRTLHSIGFGAVRYHLRAKPRVDASKYSQLIRQLLKEVATKGTIKGVKVRDDLVEWCNSCSPFAPLKGLVDKARVSLVTKPDDSRQILDVVNTFSLDISMWELGFYQLALPALLKAGEAMMPRVMDYTDMVWGPWITKAMPYRNTVVMVDEAQDLNKAQLNLALKCVKGDGRMLFVGDPHQAVYGFAGAMSDSVQKIINATNAKVLPLNECYRCPTTHLDLAREIVPHIEAAPWAKQGTVRSITTADLLSQVKSGDLVVSRLTAPLVKQCFALIKDGVAAKVRGRQIGEALVGVLEKIARAKGYRFSVLQECIGKWRESEMNKVLARNGDDNEDPQLQAIADKAATLVALLEYSEARSMRQLKDHITVMFSDGQATVWLSTVHRAKGLEADRVFILRPDMMPLPFVKGGWQLKQEYNLLYVALTRSKDELVFVTGGGND